MTDWQFLFNTKNNYQQGFQNSQAAFIEAMKRIQHTASIAGVSLKEAEAALNNLCEATQRNTECINALNTLDKKTQEPLIKMAQALKEEKQQEQKNPYLEDFEIPHYDFEDIDIKNLIDF